MEDRKEHCIGLLNSRGVTLDDIAEIVIYLFGESASSYKKEDILHSIDKVLSKREIQFALMTGIELDKAAEENRIEDPYLSEALKKDEPFYGIDETLAFGMCNVYGSIALSNFGYIDKGKKGIVAKLNEEGKAGKACHTYLDDVVGAIASCALARLSHQEAGNGI